MPPITELVRKSSEASGFTRGLKTKVLLTYVKDMNTALARQINADATLPKISARLIFETETFEKLECQANVKGMKRNNRFFSMKDQGAPDQNPEAKL
ncbi:hypothetical protein WSM22_17320 [Cytophagales bacterium WSM2-2]|nr:hypothetical protein WSM22_17320 [Cytophagales bacterium WSM2-2]